ETPRLIGRRFSREVGVGVTRRHHRAWHDGALRIDNAAADAGLIDGLLRHRGSRDGGQACGDGDRHEGSRSHRTSPEPEIRSRRMAAAADVPLVQATITSAPAAAITGY